MGRRKTFQNSTVNLNDLVSSRANRIHDVTAVECLILGPMTLLGSPDLTERNFFAGRPEDIVTEDLSSVFLLWNCDFRFCTFQDVRLAVVAGEDRHDLVSKILTR